MVVVVVFADEVSDGYVRNWRREWEARQVVLGVSESPHAVQSLHMLLHVKAGERESI